jgi:hypothetical protein
VRIFVTLAAALLISCAPAPPPVQQVKTDPTAEAGYALAIQQVSAVTRQAEELFKGGKFAEASALITQIQPLSNHLMVAPRPTLAAFEATSDLDDLYGRVLMHNNRYGWARDTFQKNAIRWKNQKPRTPDAERRYKAALDAIAECDRHL